MGRHLYIAPAGTGKTTFVLEKARERALAWGKVRVVVESRRQAQAGYRRLARKGAFGVRMHTLSGLARELLDMAGIPCTLITDPIQIRFLRALVDRAELDYYAPLIRMPGFIRALRDLFGELTRAEVSPDAFARHVSAVGNDPRLAELALIYRTYRDELAARAWTDAAGLIACAARALLDDSTLAADWDFLAVDGFTRFHASDLSLLRILGERVDEFIVTMTGDLAADWEPSVARPWQEAWEHVARALELDPRPLPISDSERSALTALATHLLQPNYRHPASSSLLTAIAAPDQAGEVRAALRWLKQRLVEEDLDLADVALIARDLAPYRDAILQTAAEFGLPLTLVGGLSLRQNPAVDALMTLLNLLTPQPASWEPLNDRRFPYRDVAAAWRSPYFDWTWSVEKEGHSDKLTITPEDADALAALARWGRVVSGAGQWWDAFRRRARMKPRDEGEEDAWREEDEPGLEALRGDAAKGLWQKWLCFRRSLTPPRGAHPIPVFVRWLEDLIGPDPSDRPSDEGASAGHGPFSLHMIARIRASGDERLIERDIAALNALKETLRGMVWAAQSLNLPPVTFQEFLTDLGGALEAARYEPQHHPGRHALMVGSVQSFAGLRFRAVAVLGLAEGLFPATLHEDAFLRGGDREAMRAQGWAIAPSPDNREAAWFYLAFSRADARVLITRPRLAEGGATWQPSPIWRWLIDAVDVEPVALTHEKMLSRFPAASTPELLLALARYPHGDGIADMRGTAGEARLSRWQHGVQVAVSRYARRFNPFDGDLSGLAAALGHRFGPGHVWSARRLETYQRCGYGFFAAHILKLASREEPMLGLDARQLGNFYHRALELVFRQGADKADDADALIAIWEAMADDLLDEAPGRFGFRPTAWWPQTREKIKATVRRTLERMAKENEGWRPRAFETPFGYQGNPALTIPHPDQAASLHLSGFIDRIDHDGQGGMRVIDYKTGDMREYTAGSLDRGEHLQLPLYALAAERALGHGRAVDGFYWSVTKAESSKLRLGKLGVEEAVVKAIHHAWEAVDGVRSGRFRPEPSSSGCRYCPAALFCWHYRKGYR